jgi:hypothetical protein
MPTSLQSVELSVVPEVIPFLCFYVAVILDDKVCTVKRNNLSVRGPLCLLHLRRKSWSDFRCIRNESWKNTTIGFAVSVFRPSFRL